MTGKTNVSGLSIKSGFIGDDQWHYRSGEMPTTRSVRISKTRRYEEGAMPIALKFNNTIEDLTDYSESSRKTILAKTLRLESGKSQ